jgi:hypothetical protein
MIITIDMCLEKKRCKPTRFADGCFGFLLLGLISTALTVTFYGKYKYNNQPKSQHNKHCILCQVFTWVNDFIK